MCSQIIHQSQIEQCHVHDNLHCHSKIIQLAVSFCVEWHFPTQILSHRGSPYAQRVIVRITMGTLCTLIPLLVTAHSISSALDDHILYFDEWRFDWDHLNDFDNDYHDDWHDVISNHDHNGYGCTHDLPPIGKKLCVLEASDGDFIFKFKNNDVESQHDSPMVSAAKELSDYYNDILLHFDDDAYWNSVDSIDGVNGYEAVRKCQPFTLMELCAVYNPFADTLNVHIKVAHSKARRRGASPPRHHRASAHRAADNMYGAVDDEEQLSIDEAITFLMSDYDDTLGYSHWRGDTLGFDTFDDAQRHSQRRLAEDEDAANPSYVHRLPDVHDRAAVHNMNHRPDQRQRTDVMDKSVQHHYHHVVDESVQHHFNDIVHHPVHADIHHILHHPLRQDVYHTVELYKHNVDNPQFVEEHVAGPRESIDDGDYTQIGAHTLYFNTLSFDWDDSRDWVSFSKQTEMHPVGAKAEEVGAHPAKLEEVGSRSNGMKTGSKMEPSRSYTKCTGAIPFVHQRACVTMAGSDVRVHLAAATEDQVNILYNGLDDIFGEMDDFETFGHFEDGEAAESVNSARTADMDSVNFHIQCFNMLFSVGDRHCIRCRDMYHRNTSMKNMENMDTISTMLIEGECSRNPWSSKICGWTLVTMTNGMKWCIRIVLAVPIQITLVDMANNEAPMTMHHLRPWRR